MIRLHMIVEGQTEEAFANRVLVPHLSTLDVFPKVQLLSPRRRNRSRRFKGGWNSYSVAATHVSRWANEDPAEEVWITTMLDLYAIPSDFPGLNESNKIQIATDRVKYLEQRFKEELSKSGVVRFIPYLQLHEFEALLFSDPKHLDCEFLEHAVQIGRLTALAKSYASPEEINNDPATAPSKRIIKEIPEYDGRKASAGPVVAEKIGLPKLRESCGHFGEWLNKLEKLSGI